MSIDLQNTIYLKLKFNKWQENVVPQHSKWVTPNDM